MVKKHDKKGKKERGLMIRDSKSDIEFDEEKDEIPFVSDNS